MAGGCGQCGASVGRPAAAAAAAGSRGDALLQAWMLTVDARPLLQHGHHARHDLQSGPQRQPGGTASDVCGLSVGGAAGRLSPVLIPPRSCNTHEQAHQHGRVRASEHGAPGLSKMGKGERPRLRRFGSSMHSRAVQGRSAAASGPALTSSRRMEPAVAEASWMSLNSAGGGGEGRSLKRGQHTWEDSKKALWQALQPRHGRQRSPTHRRARWWSRAGAPAPGARARGGRCRGAGMQAGRGGGRGSRSRAMAAGAVCRAASAGSQRQQQASPHSRTAR